MEEESNEKYLADYPNVISYETSQKMVDQMAKYICKFNIGKSKGTGFFCKIPFPDKNNMLPVFITNNHLINEELLNKQDMKIGLNIKEEKEIKEIYFNDRIKYTEKENYDITIIEIKESDNIKNYLELDDIIIDNIINKNDKNEEFSNETIYIIQYPEGKLSVSFGILDGIYEDKKYIFKHKCNTKPGSSGSPILNLNNKIIGLHCRGKGKSLYNEGIFLNYPIEKFINEKYNKNYENNNILKKDNNNYKLNPDIKKIDYNDINLKVNKIYENKKEIISRNIICPECKENIFFNIYNFKVNLYGCKNNHIYEKILINKFEETQKIDLNKIICNDCNEINMGNTNNHEFYICNTCNKNICPYCKLIHDKNHIIINYEDKNYICKIHNDSFTKYCKKCNKNMCIACEDNHEGHNMLELKNFLFKKNGLLKKVEELKKVIGKFKFKINIIKEIFDRMIHIINIYEKINDNIINNYNINKSSYHELKNIRNLLDDNETLIKDLNNIINNDKISEICEYSFDKFYYNEKGEKYFGEMKNGLKDGKGILYYDKDDEKKRDKYEGNFKNDKKEGKGILYYLGGDRYVGNWKNDKKEGEGKYYYNDGDRYEGDWKNDKIDGKGIYYWKDGDKYEGDWKNNKREGKGVKIYKKGNIYDGYWKNGIKEGKGIMCFINGDRYEGDWKNGKMEGKGTMYYKNGKIEKGNWINNEFIN